MGYPLVPPPLNDTGAWQIPRTLQRWLDINPITHLTRTQAYITLPAFNININWLGFSDIVASFNYEGPNNFSLTGFDIEPSSAPNYLLCIMWVDNKGNVKRYKLWSGVGEVLYFNIPLYTGQKIAKNFRFEIWSAGSLVPYVTYFGSPQPMATIPSIAGNTYAITPGINEQDVLLINGLQTIVLTTGTMIDIVAQGSTLIFEYPNLLAPRTNYDGQLSEITALLGGLSLTSYNIVWGANEAYMTNRLGTPESINNPGTNMVSTFISGYVQNPIIELISVTGNGLPITASVYKTATGLPLTAIINQESFQTSPIQIYTSVLGKQDYRWGTDFTLISSDIINTSFSTPNLNLPFVFPANSYPQSN